MSLTYTTGTAVTTSSSGAGARVLGPLYKPYRESIGKNREATFLVLNCPTEAECRLVCATEIPYIGADSIVVLYEPVIGIQLLDYVEITEQINETTWRVTAHYKASEASTLPQPKISFDTMGGTKGIKNSIQTRRACPTTGPAIDGSTITIPLAGIIDYDPFSGGPPQAKGADIYEPAFQWSESQYFTQDYVTEAYIAGIANLTDKYNQASFRGYPIGEVLFMGATGSIAGKRTDPNAFWEIIFHFAQKPTRTSQTIAGISGVNAYGWDLIWPLLGPPNATTGYRAITNIMVEQVYYPGDFGVLGIGS
jgi:hypothetical protein